MGNSIKFFTVAMFFLIGNVIIASPANAQENDWRNAENGQLISVNGYNDQPYVEVLPNGHWFCVFTTGSGKEGEGGQHIVSCLSTDQGKTWSEPESIEKPGKESASWAMPYLTKYGRIYVFYIYNGDKIHELKDREEIREDLLGWYCYRFTEDEGKTWSKRYRILIPKTAVDFDNDFNGKVQMMWGIGKPIDLKNGGMMFGFTRIRKYLIDSSEGWFVKCNNINEERNPKKLEWEVLPESEHGVRNLRLGPINAEHNIVQLSNGTLYCMERTISGHLAESYSYDGGKTWTVPEIPRYRSSIKLKNPRACARVWKCKNGKYLLWYHNHGGWNFKVGNRNSVWISGGVEREGKIIWTQPEILLYEPDRKKGMSYPDLIEQKSRYWVTETNKTEVRIHEIPVNFLNRLWSRSEVSTTATEGLVGQWEAANLQQGSWIKVPKVDFSKGFTLDLILNLADLKPGQVILSDREPSGKEIWVETGDYGSIKITLKDGDHTDHWISDPGIIKAYGKNEVTIMVDNGPGIIQFVIDGIASNGRSFRQYGWERFKGNMGKFRLNQIKIERTGKEAPQLKGYLSKLRIYNRPLMNTEAIGNYRALSGK